MKYISRSQWYCTNIEEFLKNDSEKRLYLNLYLYKSEVRRIEKKFPGICILVGPKVQSSYSDQRYSCIIVKKSKKDA